jgi:hypothetical protein
MVRCALVPQRLNPIFFAVIGQEYFSPKAGPG